MNKIKNGKYEGWIWESDKLNPHVIDTSSDLETQLQAKGIAFQLNDNDITFDDNKNPFVIEGMLWNAETKTSVSIKYVDGKHIINTHEVKEEDLKGSETASVKMFMTHRIKEFKSLKMLQYWEEKEDEKCLKFKSLQPGRLVFIGFNKEED